MARRAKADHAYEASALLLLNLAIVMLVSCSGHCAPHVSSAGASSVSRGSRRLHQASTTWDVWAANFSFIAANPAAEVAGDFRVSEFQLEGAVDGLSLPLDDTPADLRVTNPPADSTLYGTYRLGPSQVEQLAQAVSSELDAIPPSQSAKSRLVSFPGVTLSGEPLLDTYTTQEALAARRIPTVFAPFHAGIVFRLAAEVVPNVNFAALYFTNMTLLLPNVTFLGIHASGFMDFFEVGEGARICFSNCILALKSCDGYKPNFYHMWCCTKSQCNLLYTREALEDHGIDSTNLQHIQCVSSEEPDHEDNAATGSTAAKPNRRQSILVSAVSCIATIVALSFTVVLVWLLRRRHKARQCAQTSPWPTLNPKRSANLNTGSVAECADKKADVSSSRSGAGIDASSYAAGPCAPMTASGVTTTSGSVHVATTAVLPYACTSDQNHVHSSMELVSEAGTPSDPPTWATAVSHGLGLQDSSWCGRDATSVQFPDRDAQNKQELLDQLDRMHYSGELFWGQYQVLSAFERREGGQGVVQFMKWHRAAVEAVAVKFFLSRTAFLAEMQLHAVDALHSMMPAVQRLSDLEQVSNRSGYVFPTCMVMERGESLKDWRMRIEPGFITIVDALIHIAQRLEQLHGSGWVHRDVKPGNILWLPRLHSWTLMDFGSAAQTGHVVRLSFSLAYTPPELVAVCQHSTNVVATEAADMWALGLVAFELLTGSPVFPPFQTAKEDILDCLCGRRGMPWEAEGWERSEQRRALAGLKSAVLACLQRDPRKRPTAAEVRRSWTQLFEHHTTQEAAAVLAPNCGLHVLVDGSVD